MDIPPWEKTSLHFVCRKRCGILEWVATREPMMWMRREKAPYLKQQTETDDFPPTRCDKKKWPIRLKATISLASAFFLWCHAVNLFAYWHVFSFEYVWVEYMNMVQFTRIPEHIIPPRDTWEATLITHCILCANHTQQHWYQQEGVRNVKAQCADPAVS